MFEVLDYLAVLCLGIMLLYDFRDFMLDRQNKRDAEARAEAFKTDEEIKR